MLNAIKRISGTLGTSVAIILLINFALTLVSNTLLPGLSLVFFGLILVASIPLIPILFPVVVYFFREPLYGWDARSIWFFHAKMLYVSQGLNESTALGDPSIVSWAHTDYPKLVPLLAAQIMSSFGFWNEYLPRLALLALLVPVFYWTVSLFQLRKSFLLLLAMVSGTLAVTHSGVMDGLLAVYAGYGLFWMLKWFQGRHRMDLLNFSLSLAFCLGLKNEGQLVGLVLLGHFSLLLLLKRQRPALKDLALIWIPLVVALLWSRSKNSFHLVSEYKLFSAETFSRAWSRIGDGQSIRMISESLFFSKRAMVGLLVLFWIQFFRSDRSGKKLGGAAFSCAFLYFSIMFAVYLMTPYDLEWQLGTSAVRTILPVVAMLSVSLSLVLSGDAERVHPELESAVDAHAKSISL